MLGIFFFFFLGRLLCASGNNVPCSTSGLCTVLSASGYRAPRIALSESHSSTLAWLSQFFSFQSIAHRSASHSPFFYFFHYLLFLLFTHQLFSNITYDPSSLLPSSLCASLHLDIHFLFSYAEAPSRLLHSGGSHLASGTASRYTTGNIRGQSRAQLASVNTTCLPRVVSAARESSRATLPASLPTAVSKCASTTTNAERAYSQPPPPSRPSRVTTAATATTRKCTWIRGLAPELHKLHHPLAPSSLTHSVSWLRGAAFRMYSPPLPDWEIALLARRRRPQSHYHRHLHHDTRFVRVKVSWHISCLRL